MKLVLFKDPRLTWPELTTRIPDGIETQRGEKVKTNLPGFVTEPIWHYGSGREWDKMETKKLFQGGENIIGGNVKIYLKRGANEGRSI